MRPIRYAAAQAGLMCGRLIGAGNIVSGMSEDAAVPAVEECLRSSRRYEADPYQRVTAAHALWICTCYSDDAEAPTWLIHDVDDAYEIAWCRVPDGEPLDLVDARDSSGNHTHPGWVLLWLQGGASNPWSEDVGGGDAMLLEALRRRILAE
jgi:hypothetical protein